jgi:HEAT repeat protein
LDVLVEKLRDTKEQNLARSFAAISLGLLGETGVFPSLKKMVGSKENSDIQFGAIAALGFLNTPEIQAFLIDQLDNNKLDRIVRAQIPISLARLGCDSVVPDLVKLLGSKKVDIRMQESCVIALGVLGTSNDSYKALTDLITDGRNIQAQHFAFMSLAKIANRETEENVERITKFLLKQLVKPKKHTYTPWTGLALGVIGSELYDGLNMSNQWITINNKLVDAYEHQNNPSFKAGIGIGLALAKCNNATDMLYDTFLDTHDNGLKGYTAIALGLLRSADALDTLRNELIKTSDTKYKIQVATALGLLGDKGSTSTLINQLKTAKTLHETSALCKALGLIGDKSAINPLCDLTKDKSVPDLTRAFACVALGLLGEKTQLPWNAKLSVDCNYRLVTPSQVEVLDIL